MNRIIDNSYKTVQLNIESLFNQIRLSFEEKYHQQMKKLDDREIKIKEKEESIANFKKQSLLVSMDKQLLNNKKEINLLKKQLNKFKNKKQQNNSSEELEKIKEILETERFTKKEYRKDNESLKNQLEDSQKNLNNLNNLLKEKNQEEEWEEIEIKNKKYILNNITKKVYSINCVGSLNAKGKFKKKKGKIK